MKFVDNEHRLFYEAAVQKAGAYDDSYRQALFYVLGMLPDTRQHIDDIYDFREKCIKPGALRKAWQTSGNIRVTRMAFNLYNGFEGKVGNRKIDDPAKYTPYWLFDTHNADYFLEAIRILNGIYRNQIPVITSDKDLAPKQKAVSIRADTER